MHKYLEDFPTILVLNFGYVLDKILLTYNKKKGLKNG